jgi:hypothetical protein
MGLVASSALGFVGGLLGWFATNYFGRTLLRFWDLRLEAHETMFLYADVSADRPASLARAEDGSARLRQLGAKIDALRVALPRPLCLFLHMRNYNLRSAALGLIGLSNSLGARDTDAVGFRVQAQRALRLPIDPTERDQVELENRLDGVAI